MCCACFRNVNQRHKYAVHNWHFNFVDIGKHDDIANNATYGINTANNNRIIDDDRNQRNVDVYNCYDNRYVKRLNLLKPINLTRG